MKAKARLSWQTKRDLALLLQGFGILGIIGGILSLPLSFHFGHGLAGWLQMHGPSDLISSILSVTLGTILARSARRETAL